MPVEAQSGKELADCALLFALPLTRDDFDRAVRGEALGDYGAQLISRLDTPDSIWHGWFSRIAAEGTRLADYAERHGARVHRQATLKHVTAATRDRRVVILFAHLWSAPYELRHLHPGGIDAILARLADPDSPVARLVSPGVPRDSASIVAVLNHLIAADTLLPLLPEALRPTAVRSPSIRSALYRDLLDECLYGYVEPGNRVELHDGPCPPGRLAAAIHPAFAVAINPDIKSEIDLAACNSTILTLAIELRFDLAVRTASRITLTFPHPEFRLTLETLKAYVQEGGSYLNWRRQVAAQLRQRA